jgi:hypothetical protein
MRYLYFIAAFFLFLLSPAHAAPEAVPATAYFPVLPLDAPDKTEPQLVPLAINRSLDQAHPEVRRAVVVIHDETRDANTAMATMLALAGAQNASTIVLAPQFLLPSDIARFADYLPERGRGLAAWQVLGWSAGDDSMPGPSRKGVSSFTVVDLLLMYVTDKKIFPNVKEIVVAGFGAGANFVQRYAVFSLASDAVAKQNISLRFVVADATSYLYMTKIRPMGGKNGFSIPDPASCANVNAYPFGLEKLNPYARRMGVNAAKMNYPMQYITYIYGQGADPVPDSTCPALAQGSNGYARAENYKLYIRTLYGDVAAKTQVFAKMEEGPNDPVSLYGSSCGMAALFGNGLCH